MKLIAIVLIMLLPACIYPQSDIDKVMKGSEILLSGLTIFKAARSDPKKDSKTVESICVKNKLTQKITFRITGKDSQDNDIKKELVLQAEDKECLFELPKGIYTYEILLGTNETYRKGEYKFEDQILITVKTD
jgi:hypothetical protein